MRTDPVAVARAYLDHLTTADRALLTAEDAEGRGAPGGALDVLGRPGAIERLLSHPPVFDTVFAPARADAPLLGASPFLVFAVAVHRVAADLASATYIREWLGPGRRAPVFDVVPLREFLAAPWHRLFLAELLASYTHVASGSVVVSTRRGWRRQRFSELDPVRLAALLDVVPEAERPGILRRLGDLALFLTGVFPDHLARQGFGPIAEGRLLRAGGMPPADNRPAPAARHGAWVTRAPSGCSSCWASAGTGPPSIWWPRPSRPRWPWSASCPSASARPAGSSTSSPTGSSSVTATSGGAPGPADLPPTRVIGRRGARPTKLQA